MEVASFKKYHWFLYIVGKRSIWWGGWAKERHCPVEKQIQESSGISVSFILFLILKNKEWDGRYTDPLGGTKWKKWPSGKKIQKSWFWVNWGRFVLYSHTFIDGKKYSNLIKFLTQRKLLCNTLKTID